MTEKQITEITKTIRIILVAKLISVWVIINIVFIKVIYFLFGIKDNVTHEITAVIALGIGALILEKLELDLRDKIKTQKVESKEKGENNNG